MSIKHKVGWLLEEWVYPLLILAGVIGFLCWFVPFLCRAAHEIIRVDHVRVVDKKMIPNEDAYDGYKLTVQTNIDIYTVESSKEYTDIKVGKCYEVSVAQNESFNNWKEETCRKN